jgi:hypothetical protein
MLDRVYADVLGDHPSLTIWQTGVNDALEAIPSYAGFWVTTLIRRRCEPAFR